MQTNRNSLWRRCLALLCALTMVFTSLLTGGTLTALAAEGTVSDIPVGDFTGNVQDTGNGILVSKNDGGDHHAISNTQATAFSYEADVDVSKDPAGNGMLVFGVKNRDNPSGGLWYAVGINRDPNGGDTAGKIRLFSVDSGALKINELVDATPEQIAQTKYHFKVTVGADKTIRVYMDGQPVIEYNDPNWSGGYIGLCSFKADATYNNIKFENYDKGFQESDFVSFNGTMREEDGAFILNKVDRTDNFATSDVQADTFTYEADIEILDGSNGLLTFGIKNRERPSDSKWYGVCINRDGEGDNGHMIRLFDVNGSGINQAIPATDEQLQKTTYHYKVTVDSEKYIRFYLDDKKVIEYQDPNYDGGYIGLLSWDGEVKFSNVKLTLGEPLPDPIDPSVFNTNLENIHSLNGNWVYVEDGFQGSGNGDCFAMSDTTASDFIFEAKVNLVEGNAASLVFRAQDPPKGEKDGVKGGSYVANVDMSQRVPNARIFKFVGGSAVTLIDYTLPDPECREFDLRIEAIGGQLSYYINGALAGTYYDDTYLDGQLGLMICSSTTVYQDVFYTALDGSSSRINGLTVDGAKLNPAFDIDTYSYNDIVPYTTDKVTLTPTADAGTKIIVSNVNGVTAEEILPPLRSTVLLKFL